MHIQDLWIIFATLYPRTRLEVEEPSAKAGGAIGFEVDDVKATTDRLKAKGVKIKLEPFETPGCHMAMVYDPEGNGVILHQQKPR